MRIARRLKDAGRSPQRLWWFGVRAAKLALDGGLGSALARVRPRSPGAARYRTWLAAHPPPPADMASALREARIDSSDARIQQRVLERLAALAPPPARVLVRSASGGFVPVAGHARTAPLDADGVLLIGEDVVLQPDLGARFAAALAAHPGAVAAYGDYDHLDAKDRRERPHLAPSWDADQARERLVCGPLLCLREGPALRAAETARAGDGISAALDELARQPHTPVLHVPEVLCHLPADAEARWQTANAEHAGRMIAARPQYRNAALAGRRLSVIIPTRDRVELLRRCVASLPPVQGGQAVEIVLVDNGSRQPEFAEVCDEWARTRDLTVLARPAAFNFAALCNAGAKKARGDVLLFLNNDAYFAASKDVDELVALARQPWTGAAGPWLFYEDGRVQSAGVLVGVNRTATSALAGFAADDAAARAWAASRRRVSAVMGACLIVERHKFAQVGGFDERFAVSHNEVDLCLRLEAAGYANVVTPYARVMHVEGATRGFEVSPDERARLDAEERLFLARWGRLAATTDPAHHPWLSRNGNPFDLAAGPVDFTPRLGWRSPNA